MIKISGAKGESAIGFGFLEFSQAVRKMSINRKRFFAMTLVEIGYLYQKFCFRFYIFNMFAMGMIAITGTHAQLLFYQFTLN